MPVCLKRSELSNQETITIMMLRKILWVIMILQSIEFICNRVDTQKKYLLAGKARWYPITIHHPFIYPCIYLCQKYFWSVATHYSPVHFIHITICWKRKQYCCILMLTVMGVYESWPGFYSNFIITYSTFLQLINVGKNPYYYA